ncbi:Verru_Chthon cassette protein C [Verrucomicrobiota bacterium sgz303538]
MINSIPGGKLIKTRPARAKNAFTTVELLASMALLAGVMVLLVSTVDQTQRVWRRTSEKATQFQGARAAFESMTRRLSQATLNTYWRAFDSKPDQELRSFRFRRVSDLHFLSAPAAKVFGTSPKISDISEPVEAAYPTHAVFFNAPLGYTEELNDSGSSNSTNSLRFGGLDNLLNGCGYFVEYGPDTDRPAFLKNVPGISERYRFRLMEMTVPTERLSVFQRPVDSAGWIDPRVFDENKNYPYEGILKVDGSLNTSWVRPLWLKDALSRRPLDGDIQGTRFRFARPRAENVIAMVILPKLAEKDRKKVDEPELAPDYAFDSWRIIVRGVGTVRDGNGTVKIDNVARYNLLPPIVQVTMVAVDEASMARLNLDKDNVPEWTDGLFKNAKKEELYRQDVHRLEERLQADKLNYRVFTTDVVIRGSKWSRNPFAEQIAQPD